MAADNTAATSASAADKDAKRTIDEIDVTHLLKYVPKDRGWAWMCVLGGFLMNMLVVGAAAKSYGILFVEFVETFHSSSAATSWVSALSQGLALISGPFAATLAAHFNARKIVFVGGLLASLGMALSMFAPNVEFLFFSYGLLVGIGSGLSYTPTIVLIGMYFEKRRSLANGLCVAGSGVGNLVFPPVFRLLLDYYSLRGTLLILAGLMLNLLVCAMLLRPLSFYFPNNPSQTILKPIISEEYLLDNKKTDNLPIELKQTDNISSNRHGEAGEAATSMDIISNDVMVSSQEAIHTPRNCCSNICKALARSKFDWALLKNPLFLLYGFSLFFCFFGYPSLFIILPAHCKNIGIPKQKAAYLVAIIGFLDLFSRVFFGWFSDLNLVKKGYIFCFSLILSGVGFCVMPFLSSFLGLAILCGVMGLFAGSFVALIAPILVDCLGIKRLPSAFGLAMMAQGLPFFIAPPVVGLLEDMTGEWTWSFIFAGVSMLVAGVIPLFEPVIKQRMSKTESKQMNEAT